MAARASAVVATTALGVADGPLSPEPARSSAARRLARRQRKSAAALARAVSGSAPATSAEIAAASASSLPWPPSRPRWRWRRPRLAGVARRAHRMQVAPNGKKPKSNGSRM